MGHGQHHDDTPGPGIGNADARPSFYSPAIGQRPRRARPERL